MLHTAAFVLLCLSLATGARAGDELTRAQKVLFDTPHLDNVETPQTLRYDFVQRSEGQEPVEDRIEVVVTEIAADGSKNVTFNFLSGERQRRFPALTGFRGNPIIMLFLERDVELMAAATGGSELFFRNRIRESFGTLAEVEEVTLSREGGDMPASLVTVAPFREAPLIDRFPRYRNKRYEFLVSDGVRGGVARLTTILPGEGGASEIEETVTFRESEP